MNQQDNTSGRGMPVVVEVPTTWLKSAWDGDRNRTMFEALCDGLSRTSVDVSFVEVKRHRDFYDRSAPSAGFRLSYHSCGSVPHVWRIKETPIPYYYSFDRFGFSGWSDLGLYPDRHIDLIIKQPFDQSERYTTSLRDEMVATNTSKYRQSSEFFFVAEPFVFFPLQMRYDVVARLCRLDPLKVLLKAADLAKRYKTRLVVKRHPYCRNPLVRWALYRATRYNPYVTVTTASVQKILPLCSSVLVANSGVGFEALVHGKPVFTFAGSEYELATCPLNDLSEMDIVFSGEARIDVSRTQRFVRYYLTECCFDARDPSDIDRKLGMAIDAARSGNWPEIARNDCRETIGH